MLDPLALLAIAEFLGMSPAKLSERWRRFKAAEDVSRQEERTRERFAARTRIAEDRLDSALLEAYYPESEVRLAGFQRYSFLIGRTPVTTSVITRSDWTNLRIPLLERPPSDSLIKECPILPTINKEESERILFDLNREGRKVFNAPLFELVDIDVRATEFKATYCICDYFTYLTTLGVMEDELIQALMAAEYDVSRVLQRKNKLLAKRERFLPNVDIFRDCRQWLCTGGVNVLFAIRRPPPEDDFMFLAQRRSTRVATGRGGISLVPQGFHQPKMQANAKSEMTLENSIFREIYEEAFKGTEVEQDDNHIDHQWYFHKCPGVQWFREEGNRGAFHLEVVCFGFNLTRGNYEFGTLLAVTDPEYFAKFYSHMGINWEYRDQERLKFSTKEPTELAKLLSEPSWIDASRVALIQGLKRLNEIDPNRVLLPDLSIISP